MTLPMILDVGIAGILLIFLIRGMQLGFVRALCSFLAVFVALFGALFLSRLLAAPLADLLAPHVLPAIVEKLESATPTLPSTQNLSLQDTEALLQVLGLPENWSQFLGQLNSTSDQSLDPTLSPAQMFAASILQIILSSVLFIVSFFLLLLLWRIVSRSLDLVARLPVLNFCNRILGALFGLLKAVLFLFLLRWVLCDLLGQIPPDVLLQTHFAKVFYSQLSHFQFDGFFPL